MRWLRRLLILGAVVAAGVFIVRRRADANVEAPLRPAGEDQWPPIAVPGPSTPTIAEPEPDEAGPAVTGPPAADETVALERPMPAWVVPVDGACPITHPIKLNASSGIFHLPGGRFYDRTIPQRCYAEAEDAVADGYRAAKA